MKQILFVVGMLAFCAVLVFSLIFAAGGLSATEPADCSKHCPCDCKDCACNSECCHVADCACKCGCHSCLCPVNMPTSPKKTDEVEKAAPAAIDPS